MLARTIFFTQNKLKEATGNVTITVKKYFLDPENDFEDTFIEYLNDINVEIVGQETKQTVNGVATFNLPADTYTVKVYDMDAQLTTCMFEIEVDGSVNKEVKLYALKHTPTEVQEMIDEEGLHHLH